MWNLIERPYRFNKLKRQIGQISTKVLFDQLAQMEEVVLLTRHANPTTPPQVEYRVTKSHTPQFSDCRIPQSFDS